MPRGGEATVSERSLAAPVGCGRDRPCAGWCSGCLRTGGRSRSSRDNRTIHSILVRCAVSGGRGADDRLELLRRPHATIAGPRDDGTLALNLVGEAVWWLGEHQTPFSFRYYSLWAILTKRTSPRRTSGLRRGARRGRRADSSRDCDSGD